MKHFQQTIEWMKAKSEASEKIKYTYVEKQDIYVQLNKIPFTSYFFGYIPRVNCNLLDFDYLNTYLKKLNCVGYQVDPANYKSESKFPNKFRLTKAVALKYNVIINLQLKDEELLGMFKPKHRYNIKVSQRSNLDFRISNSEEDYEKFYELYLKNAIRRKYPPRSKKYLDSVYKNFEDKVYIANVYFNNELLVSWFLILYEETVYFVYGGSNDLHKEKMSSYFLLWNIIRYFQGIGIKYIDLMGIKDPKTTQDGFTRFKLGWSNGRYIEYQDSFDVVLSRFYYIFKFFYYIKNFIFP